MTSDEGEDPSRGENQIEAKQLKLSWQPKEKSSSGELQRQSKKEEEDIIFIQARTTEEPRRRFVFDSKGIKECQICCLGRVALKEIMKQTTEDHINSGSAFLMERTF